MARAAEAEAEARGRRRRRLTLGTFWGGSVGVETVIVTISDSKEVVVGRVTSCFLPLDTSSTLKPPLLMSFAAAVTVAATCTQRAENTSMRRVSVSRSAVTPSAGGRRACSPPAYDAS